MAVMVVSAVVAVPRQPVVLLVLRVLSVEKVMWEMEAVVPV
jgi:hypothetical protein